MQLYEFRLGSTDTTCLSYFPDDSPWLGQCFLSMSDGVVAAGYYQLLVSRGERLRGNTLEEFLRRAAEHYEVAKETGVLVKLEPRYKNFWYGVSLVSQGKLCSLSRRGWKEPFWSGRRYAMRTIHNR